MKVYLIQFDEDGSVYNRVFLNKESAEKKEAEFENAGMPCWILETKVHKKDMIVH